MIKYLYLLLCIIYTWLEMHRAAVTMKYVSWCMWILGKVCDSARSVPDSRFTKSPNFNFSHANIQRDVSIVSAAELKHERLLCSSSPLHQRGIRCRVQGDFFLYRRHRIKCSQTPLTSAKPSAFERKNKTEKKHICKTFLKGKMFNSRGCFDQTDPITRASTT